MGYRRFPNWPEVVSTMNAPTLLDKWRVMERAFSDPDLTDRDRKVLFFVLGRLDNSMGYADLSLPWIAQQAGLGGSKGNAVKSLAKLQDGGYLTWRKGGGRAARNRYSLASIGSGVTADTVGKKGVASDTLYQEKGVMDDTGKGVTSDTGKGVASDTPNIVLESRLKNPSYPNQQAASLHAAPRCSAGTEQASKPKLKPLPSMQASAGDLKRQAEKHHARVLRSLMERHRIDKAGVMLLLIDMTPDELIALFGKSVCEILGYVSPPTLQPSRTLQ